MANYPEDEFNYLHTLNIREFRQERAMKITMGIAYAAGVVTGLMIAAGIGR